MIPGHPGPGGRGGCREVRGRRPWRGGSRGRASSAGGRVECQLIMSLLLTPYVEFFMLSFTSLLNTDKFCVNLQKTHTEHFYLIRHTNNSPQCSPAGGQNQLIPTVNIRPL